MNYGMDDVLIGWASVARGANPAQAVRVAAERSAFADLFDSQVHFAGFDGRGATAAAAMASEARPEHMVAAPQMGARHGFVHQDAGGRNGASAVPPPAAVNVHSAVGRPQMSVAPVPVTVLADRAGSSTAAALRSPLDPAQCQWSRSAFAACLRDGALNLYVRDGALLRNEREVADVLKQALRGMGISLSEIKINGIDAGA